MRRRLAADDEQSTFIQKMETIKIIRREIPLPRAVLSVESAQAVLRLSHKHVAR